MPKGAKHRFSEKEDRQAQHIIDSEMERGVDERTARGIAYGHLNNERRHRTAAASKKRGAK